MLIEAGNQHKNAELVGQDVDARCARISAINLGLRGKYGWIICGNTLTREVRFVYRIGSFFHEGPNGNRRGVIREFPPEECPVLPELSQQTRQDLFETLDQSDDLKPPNTNSGIVEVPRWLFRLEGQLVSSPTTEDSETEQTETSTDKPDTLQEKEISKPDTPPSKPSQKKPVLIPSTSAMPEFPFDKSNDPDKESNSPNQHAKQQQAPQQFRITQCLYQYQRFLVTALTYEEAMQKLLEAAPVDSEVSFFAETDDVKPLPNDATCNEVFFDEVVSVDSADQSETYYERE